MQTSDLIILLVLLGCMATYIPVFMCLFFTAVLGLLFFTDIPILLLAQSIFRSMDNFALVVVLFFILCGNIFDEIANKPPKTFVCLHPSAANRANSTLGLTL